MTPPTLPAALATLGHVLPLEVADGYLRGSEGQPLLVAEKRALVAVLNAAPAMLAFVERVADMDPIGIVDYEDRWSDVTPGAGPLDGCIFCKSRTATVKGGHFDACLWMEARRLLGRETP